MAMGQKGAQEASKAFSNHTKFANSTGSLRGVVGAPRDVGRLDKTHRESVKLASYVIYSYETPIAWAIEDETTGLFERVMPDESYSPTTDAHQSLVKTAWADSYHDGTEKGRKAWASDHRRQASA
jgi:hypothetical protein